jgi:hypothetical protein
MSERCACWPNMATPDFSTYTKDHWSFLLYIETLLVDRQPLDHRRMNEADRDAAEEMESHGLLIWGGTGINPVFSFTDHGWAVAHATRRARAEKVSRELWHLGAARAFEAVPA